MLKYSLFRPTVKYVTTPCTPKIIAKKFYFFFAPYIKKCQASQQKTKLSNDLNINNREKPIDLSIKNKQMTFCSNLPFGTLLSLWTYVDTESTDIFFSNLENEYKLSRTKSKQMPKMSLYSGLLKKLKEDSRNTMIEKIKNELKDLKNMLNKIKELELSREQEINKIKNETKRELNMLHDEISDILEKLDVNVLKQL